MRYLLLGCDPGGKIPLWDEFEGPSDSWPLPLADDLKAALADWNDRMTALVARPELHDPTELANLCKRLNAQGAGLADRLNRDFDGQAKVRFLPERR